MSGNIQDNYSPNWVPYFTPEGNLLPGVGLSVECGICNTKLAITNQVDHHHESFTMLPCGHVFGHECVTKWLTHKPNCPMCRKSFEHRICHHYADPQEIQGGADFNICRDLPPTMAVGEQLPGFCNKCYRNPPVNPIRAKYFRRRVVWPVRPSPSEFTRLNFETGRAEIRPALEDEGEEEGEDEGGDEDEDEDEPWPPTQARLTCYLIRSPGRCALPDSYSPHYRCVRDDYNSPSRQPHLVRDDLVGSDRYYYTSACTRGARPRNPWDFPAIRLCTSRASQMSVLTPLGKSDVVDFGDGGFFRMDMVGTGTLLAI
ncbi:hypothetical protein EKO27_g4241 [Xylaria grammica]|uniref:RING-type domain-containing protein n=1 Tax=Xylaria grammica TaxID=363999 RepID=A0A439D8Y1_9PEZI|nr:hypothetical protein EKO27_g4241 [Xylaria grammica]